MNIDGYQYQGLIAALSRIEHRLPEPAEKAKAPTEPNSLTGARIAGQRQALSSVLIMLYSCIEGGQENHEALGHRGEDIGEECWNTFRAPDIKNMIDEAARSLGIYDLFS